MNTGSNIKQYLLLLIDMTLLYLSLATTIYLRYGLNSREYSLMASAHYETFSVLFLVWIILFYIFGLYDLKYAKNDLYLVKNFATAIGTAAIFTIVFFYLTPSLITPKTNLFLLLAIFSTLEYIWRYNFNRVISRNRTKENLLFIGKSQTTDELGQYITANPQLGYTIKFSIGNNPLDNELGHISQIMIAENITTIVMPDHIKKNQRAAEIIYNELAAGANIADLSTLYERILQKIPLEEIEETWFLENISSHHRFYDIITRPIERATAFILLIALTPLLFAISALIKLTSKGPAILKQVRTGQYGKDFTLYKFRSMIATGPDGSAEADTGAVWAIGNDKRITPFGKFLRAAHLDELPQLWNIARGELAFVGPRPERPELIQIIKKEVPFFELRELATPGITGWAQINYHYGASVEDASRKLEYDLYYIKNRSLILDLLIMLRTLKKLI